MMTPRPASTTPRALLAALVLLQFTSVALGHADMASAAIATPPNVTSLAGMLQAHRCAFGNTGPLDKRKLEPENVIPQNYHTYVLAEDGKTQRRVFGPQAQETMRITVSSADLTDSTKYCGSSGETRPDMQGGTVTCTSDQILTTAKRDFLLNTILPTAITKLQNALLVTRTSSNLFIDSCSHNTVPTSHNTGQTGVASTDFVIYVSAAQTSGSVAAFASECKFDQNGRPVAGRINFAPKYIPSDNSDTQATALAVNIAMHEMMHALGFPTLLSSSKKTKTLTNRASKTATYLDTTKVLEVGKAHFNCNTLFGVELEDEGTGAGSHWDKRVLTFDVMNPVSHWQNKLTKFTLAYFEDTGKYTADFTKADDYYFGKDQGCDFVDAKCDTTGGGKDTWFCFNKAGVNHATNNYCTYDRTYVGYCDVVFSVSVDSKFQYTDLGQFYTSGVSYQDGCPIVVGKSNLYCPSANTNGLCFATGATSLTTRVFGCHETKCTNYVLQVNVGNNLWVDCSAAGEVTIPSGATASGSLLCPSPVQYCGVATPAPATPAPPTPAPATPAPVTPAPATPTPATPAPATPAPATPAPATPAPATPAPATPTPATPAPATPAPGTPTPGSTPSPATPAPATPVPATPAPATPAPATPAPGTPTPGTPAPATPAPATPTPGTPTPGSTPTPATPAPATPAPGTPTPGSPVPGTPAPGTPSPGTTPTPGTPTPGTPAPGTPAPATPTPGSPSPATPAPGSPTPATATPATPAPGTTPPTPAPTTPQPPTPAPGTPTPATPAPPTPQPATLPPVTPVPPGTPPATPTPDRVAEATDRFQATVTITGNSFGTLVANDEASLRTSVQKDIATTASVQQDQVIIHNLTVGSLIVDFEISTATGSTTTQNTSITSTTERDRLTAVVTTQMDASATWLANTAQVYSTVNAAETLQVASASTVQLQRVAFTTTLIAPTASTTSWNAATSLDAATQLKIREDVATKIGALVANTRLLTAADGAVQCPTLYTCVTVDMAVDASSQNGALALRASLSQAGSFVLTTTATTLGYTVQYSEVSSLSSFNAPRTDSSSTCGSGCIAGVVVGATVFVAVCVVLGMFASRHFRHRAESKPKRNSPSSPTEPVSMYGVESGEMEPQEPAIYASAQFTEPKN